MSPKLWLRLRAKILYLFAFSLLLSAGTVAFLYVVVAIGIDTRFTLLRPFVRWAYYSLGLPFTLTVTVLVFFVLYLLLISRSSIRYLLQITRGLEQIADGNFDFRIPVLTQDELGVLAANINAMNAKLKSSIEEERRAERTKAELVTNVSHDIRTPLTSIVGYLGLIEQDRCRDEVELRQYVQIAYEKSLRLNVLVNDLFEYTRTSGGLGLQVLPLNLVELLGQLAAQYRHSFAQAEMECRLMFHEKMLTVRADGNKLARVFENLLINALQYGREGKRVDLTVRRDGSEAAVEVANYGSPLPPSSLPHLFERFYRVEQSRAQHTGGSGLGLAIAKNIVELHGGTISVASDSARTTFEVRLPLG